MDTKTRIISGLRFSVILMGLIGNIITLIVYSRPVFKKNSISVYCRALALFESLIMSIDLIYEYGITFFNYYLGAYSDLACIIYHYSGMVFGSIPGWILIAFSIDKLLSMTKNTIRNSLIKKRSFQIILIALIVLINLSLYIEIPIYLRLVSFNVTNTTYIICDVSNLSFAVYVSSMYLIEGSFVPFLVMFTISIIMIIEIRKSSRRLSTARHFAAWVHRRNKRDMKFAVTSIAFNFVFILLKLPIVVLLVLMNFISSLSSADLSLELTYFLYFVNYSIGLIIHLVSNNLFRREFSQLFTFTNQFSENTA